MTYKVLELGAHLHTSVAPAVDGDNFRSTFNAALPLGNGFWYPSASLLREHQNRPENGAEQVKRVV